MSNLVKWGLGLVALGVTAYVVGRAWKKSQSNGSKDISNVDTGSSANMSGYTYVDGKKHRIGPTSSDRVTGRMPCRNC